MMEPLGPLRDQQRGSFWIDRQHLPDSALAPAALFLLCAACALAWLTLRLFANTLGWFALGSWLCSIGCLLTAFRLAPAPEEPRDAAPQAMLKPALRPGLTSACISVVLALAAAVALFRAPVIDVSLLLFPAAAFSGWCGEQWLRGRRLRGELRNATLFLHAHRLELLAVASITAAGMAMRFLMIQQYALAHGSVSDELLVGQAAWQLAHAPAPWPAYVQTGGAVGMYQPIAAAFALFGASMHTFRVTLLLQSVFLVPGFYLLARQFVAVAAALCAATLLALAYWPATMSVLAFGWLQGAVFQAVGIALLVRGLRFRSYVTSTLGGAILALCFYSYIGHRIMPLVVLPFLCAFVLTGSGALGQRVLLSFMAILGFALAAMPWLGAVTMNEGLLNGDATALSSDFQQRFHQQPLAALGDALTAAGHLGMTVLASPQSNDFSVLVVPGGGLLDTVTAILALLGLTYALVFCRRPQNLLVVFAVLVPVAIASLAPAGFISVYRLNSAIPGLFLAMALLLDRGMDVARRIRIDPRWSLAVLILIGSGAGLANIRQASAQLASCAVLLGNAGPLDLDDGEPILLADLVNAQGPRQAVFVIARSHHFPPDQVAWLYHAAYRLYDPSSGGTDPARWPLTYIQMGSGQTSAAFWPPRLLPSQQGVTYIMTDDDARLFMPIVQRMYRGGRTQLYQLPVCPSFTITTYTLTARQVAMYR